MKVLLCVHMANRATEVIEMYNTFVMCSMSVLYNAGKSQG